MPFIHKKGVNMGLTIPFNVNVNIDRSQTKPVTQETVKQWEEAGGKEALTNFLFLEKKRMESEANAIRAAELESSANLDALESKQLAASSKQKATKSKQSDMESKQLAAKSKQSNFESKQSATESKQLAAENKELLTEGQASLDISEQKKIESKQLKAASNQVLNNVADKKKLLFAQKFYETFSKKPTANEVATISTYLKDGEFNLQKVDGKPCTKINSMIPFTRYLDSNKEITECNFQHFKTHVSDIGTLVNYVTQQSCPVKVLKFQSNIDATFKACLETAKKQKNLDIQYL